MDVVGCVSINAHLVLNELNDNLKSRLRLYLPKSQSPMLLVLAQNGVPPVNAKGRAELASQAKGESNVQPLAVTQAKVFKPPGGTRFRLIDNARPVLHEWNNGKILL